MTISNYNIFVADADSGRLKVNLTFNNPKDHQNLHCEIRTHWRLTGKILSWFGKAVEIYYTDKQGKSRSKYINVGSLFKHVYCPQEFPKSDFEKIYKKIRFAICKGFIFKDKQSTVQDCLVDLNGLLLKSDGINAKINQIWKISSPKSNPPTVIKVDTPQTATKGDVPQFSVKVDAPKPLINVDAPQTATKVDTSQVAVKVDASQVAKVNVPQSPIVIDSIDPFSPIDLPKLLDQIKNVFNQLGIKEDGSIDDDKFQSFLKSDPKLIAYQKTVIQAIQFLFIANIDAFPLVVMKNLRIKYPSFGFGNGQDLSEPKNAKLNLWLLGRMANKLPAEYPFKSINKVPKISDKGLQSQVVVGNLIPEFSADQLRVAKKVGFVNSKDQPLWMLDSSYQEKNAGKPKQQSIALTCLMGNNLAELMTGPAFEVETLKNDRASFELTVNKDIIPKEQIEHFVTDTLVVTAEGDKNLIRPNGLDYIIYYDFSKDPEKEKHRFRSNVPRKFIEGAYQGKDAYSKDALQEVEAYDSQLLSDQERRRKRMGFLASSYVTVTAQGGYKSARFPLDRPCRVLYLATAGAQFEKYGRGSFQYQDGVIDANELEVADFIIKKGAKVQNQPLFPHYYFGGKIPAHQEINSSQCSKFGDGDFTKAYLKLNDGALFNRAAFQISSDEYLNGLVLPTAVKRTAGQPYYLKATLWGGGFFANAGKAGNLRLEVINALLTSYIKAIDQGQIPSGSAIEFLQYGNLWEIPNGLIEQLKIAAAKKKIDIVWAPNGDICDFKPQKSVDNKVIDLEKFEKAGCLICLGAADGMSWHGNEPGSDSVEAVFANNSNLRLVMNWWANPKVLEIVQSITHN